MKFIFTFLLCLYMANLIRSDYILNIKMEYFKNEQVNLDNQKIYFDFCLQSSPANCDSKFQTNILGLNKISQEQFELTTDSINFKILDSQLNTRDYFLNLSISVLTKPHNQVLSTWNLFIEKNSQDLLKLNKWITFNQINFDLKQQMTFNYKLKCSDLFQGPQCSIPVCSSGCDLTKGGYCEKPNQCLCKQGWTGLNCDNKIEYGCDLECKNGGVCVNDNGIKYCKCESKFYQGDLCQIRVAQACGSKCFNGGSCLANGECLCAPGYAGEFCQIKKTSSECGTFSCLNGGTCFIDNQNEYSCVCTSGFFGKNCQNTLTTTTAATIQTTVTTTTTTSTTPAISIKQIEKESSSFGNQEIIIILTAGVLIPILAILVAIIFYKSLISKKQTESVEEPKVTKPEVKQAKKENIYVVCNTNSNLNSVRLECEKKQNEFTNETEVYSNCIYEDLNEYSKENNKKSETKSNKASNIYSEDLVSYV